jgi:hypothetical protein
MWVWIVFGAALAAMVLFIVLFYIFVPRVPTHEITVVNNSTVGMTIRAGTLVLTQEHTFTTQGVEMFINPNSETKLHVTPGVALTIFAWQGTNIVPMATTVFINLPANGYLGPYQINNVQLPSETDLSTIQAYSISLASGANLKASITPTNTSCTPIEFVTGIPESTCPAALRYGSPYIGCMSPCWQFVNEPTGPTYCCLQTGVCETGCQNSWPDISYYNVFKDACPDCSITNCDLPTKTCENVGGLTGFKVVFDLL